MQLTELIFLCTNLQKHVLDLEKAKDAQQKRCCFKEEGPELYDEMFVMLQSRQEEHIQKLMLLECLKIVLLLQTIPVTTAATTLQISKDKLTLTQTLMVIKVAKPKVVTTVTTTVSTEFKAKGVSIQEPSETTTRVVITPSKVKARDKGKAIMVEPPLKKKDQIALDAELAFKLHAEEQAELEKIQKERIKNECPRRRLQSEEQEQYNDEEKAKLFMELLEKKRKFFARKKEIEKRNRPPTKAQQRNLMFTYLKNMDGWKLKSLKNKSFSKVQKLFDSAMKRINTFVDMDTEIVEKRSRKTQAKATEGSSKRVGDELESDVSKK
ncbi:hypothetical protein Tco_1448977 [Tanacetum coccineum]